jgi:hypothetical protein
MQPVLRITKCFDGLSDLGLIGFLSVENYNDFIHDSGLSTSHDLLAEQRLFVRAHS